MESGALLIFVKQDLGSCFKKIIINIYTYLLLTGIIL